MKRILFILFLCATAVSPMIVFGQTLIQQGGWFESAYCEWSPISGATSYNVYYALDGSAIWTQIDSELIRQYPNRYRADVIGLKEGKYKLKVVPVQNGAEMTQILISETPIIVSSHDRSGFAHVGYENGLGAYNNDGTLKTGARVLYVTANNAADVTLEMAVGSGKTETRKGLQNILQAYEKGIETRPTAIRIIGTIKKEDLDAVGSSAEGLQVKGKSNGSISNLTIEGVGNDATVHGFGFLVRGITGVEFRNFAVMLCMDDCMSIDTENHHIWIHNMDFFYGAAGGAADQDKGDGTVDIKGKSSHVTISYNHFFDAGKCSLGGMKSETTDCWMSYHHNWFDHSDSRHPRIRTAFYHCYNNYYDGISKYGVGCTSGGSAFVEKNYFRNCKYPMLISKQGTDTQGDGTFSGESGGVIKAYDNIIINAKQVLYYDGKQTDGVWDAVKVNSRDEEVNAIAYSGGTSYNSSADMAAQSAVVSLDEAENVALICRGELAGREGLGAGRLQGGDFKWTFNYALQDANYAVIDDLKQAVENYKSTLIGFADGQSIKNGGATETVNGGDGKGMKQTIDATTPAPTWGGDVIEDPDFEEEPYIASSDNDIFWFGENESHTTQFVADGVISMTNGSVEGKKSSWVNDFYTTTTSKGVTYTSDHVGAFGLAQASAKDTYNGGTITFYCPNGVTSFKVNVLRSGDNYMQVQKSTDGVNFSTVVTASKISAGVVTRDFTANLRDKESTEPVWIRLVNGSTGNLYVFGVQISQLPIDGPSLTDCDLQIAEGKDTISLSMGSTFTLQKGVDFTTSSLGSISYSTSNANVASIDANGVITGVAGGVATIGVSIAKTDVMKAGKVTFVAVVSDSRAESSFALSTETSVSLEVGETFQILTTGAAGEVTYESEKSSVATVDADGLITAIGVGNAEITITDSGSKTIQGRQLKMLIFVTKNMAEIEICEFSEKCPSLPEMVAISGHYSSDKGSITYAENEYSVCVKMESSTSISITPVNDCFVTLVFDPESAGKSVKINGEKVTILPNGTYTFSATGGRTYIVTKGDIMNLFLIIFEKNTSSVDKVIVLPKVVKTIIDGQMVIIKDEKRYLITGQVY